MQPKTCKVWVVGPHRSGKSVLTRWIAKRYGLPLFDEVARIQIAKIGATNFDQLRIDLDAVTQFQRGVFAEQLLIGRDIDRFVSDRALDNLAYCCENATVDTVADLWESPACRDYVKGIADDVEQRRGAVFFVRPGVAVVNDGTCATSDLDVGSIHRIDGMIKILLGLGRVKAVPIHTTIFQERASIVDGVLRNIL